MPIRSARPGDNPFYGIAYNVLLLFSVSVSHVGRLGSCVLLAWYSMFNIICEGDSNDLKVYQGVQMVKIGEQITINLNNTSAARTVGLL